MRRAPIVGAALTPHRVWLVHSRTGEVLVRALDGEASTDGRWPALDAALAELRAELRLSPGGALAVALLPPLAQVRRLALPLRDVEGARVLARDAARWFFAAREPQVTAARSLRGRRRRGDRALLAAAAPRRVVEAVDAAGRATGWRAVRVLPAAISWWSAAPAAGAVVAAGGALHVLCGDEGRPLAPRRVRGADGALDRAIALLPPASGEAPPLVVEDADAAARLAAEHAPAARALELRAPAGEGARWQRARRMVAGLLAAASLVAAAAAALVLVDVRRELAQAAAARARIGAAVSARLDADAARGALHERAAVVRTAERAAPRWSGVLATLGEHLPLDAHLTGFRAVGDTVFLGGDAESAAGVFAALRSMPGLAEVRAEAPIRRETTADGVVVERFALVARAVPVGGRAAPPSPAGMVARSVER